MNKFIAPLLIASLAACASSAPPPSSTAAGPSPAQRFRRPAKPETAEQRDARVKAGAEEAARLIRECVPLVEEVRGAAENASAYDRDQRQELRRKAGEAEVRLEHARAVYRAIELDSPEQEQIAGRMKSISEALATLRGAARKL